MKNVKGGYKIISLEENDLTASFSVHGIYNALSKTYDKTILVSGIVIDGEKKNDAYTEVNTDSTDYKFTVYGYEVTVSSDDSVEAEQKIEITSIGDGLSLTDGELSATGGGGKIYSHIMSVTNGTGVTILVSFISSSNTPSTFKDFMEKIRNTTAESGVGSNPYVSATGSKSGSSNIYGLIPSSATQVKAFGFKKGDGYTEETTLNYADLSIQDYKIVEM